MAEIACERWRDARPVEREFAQREGIGDAAQLWLEAFSWGAGDACGAAVVVARSVL